MQKLTKTSSTDFRQSTTWDDSVYPNLVPSPTDSEFIRRIHITVFSRTNVECLIFCRCLQRQKWNLEETQSADTAVVHVFTGYSGRWPRWWLCSLSRSCSSGLRRASTCGTWATGDDCTRSRTDSTWKRGGGKTGRNKDERQSESGSSRSWFNMRADVGLILRRLSIKSNHPAWSLRGGYWAWETETKSGARKWDLQKAGGVISQNEKNYGSRLYELLRCLNLQIWFRMKKSSTPTGRFLVRKQPRVVVGSWKSSGLRCIF